MVAALNQPLSFRDSIGEVRRCNVDLAHAAMQPLERVCVLGWRDFSRRHKFVVGPQRDYEAVTHVDARLHSRLKRSDGALGFRQSLSKLDFERSPGLMQDVCDPSNDVTGQQAQNEPVRVLKHNSVIDHQVKC